MVFLEFRLKFTKFYENLWISSHTHWSFLTGFPMSSMGGCVDIFWNSPIWLEIVTKFLEAHCHYKRIQWTLYFLIKKVCNFDILSWFLCKIYSRLCLLAYNSGTTTHMAKRWHPIMHLPFVNLGAKSQSNSFDAYHFETLCLQHTSARLLLILQNPRLSRW